jgi:hypothetical protein
MEIGCGERKEKTKEKDGQYPNQIRKKRSYFIKERLCGCSVEKSLEVLAGRAED